jgi:hypothetical protein
VGNVLISLDEKHERLLRRLVEEKHQGRRGAISAVVAEGIDAVAEKSHRRAAAKRLIEGMRKGVDFGLRGRKAYESRDEIYD